MLSILIVEDDILLSDMLKSLLSQNGYDTMVYSNTYWFPMLNGGWGRKRSIWLYRIYACRIVTGSTY